MAIVAANWKLNKTPDESRAFIKELLTHNISDPQVVIFPPTTSLDAVSQELKSGSVTFGPQNCYFEASGAFTGEVSPKVVKDLGATWALLGHSERRTLFGETDPLIRKKVAGVQKYGLRPMLCVGETLDERESGKTNVVLERQLKVALESSGVSEFAVAYEPVWAIGTGRVAEAAQVQEAHAFIFNVLLDLQLPKTTPILYGGSVKGDNAVSLARLPHVSGFLVGGASLDVPSFLQIVQACKTP